MFISEFYPSAFTSLPLLSIILRELSRLKRWMFSVVGFRRSSSHLKMETWTRTLGESWFSSQAHRLKRPGSKRLMPDTTADKSSSSVSLKELCSMAACEGMDESQWGLQTDSTWPGGENMERNYLFFSTAVRLYRSMHCFAIIAGMQHRKLAPPLAFPALRSQNVCCERGLSCSQHHLPFTSTRLLCVVSLQQFELAYFICTTGNCEKKSCFLCYISDIQPATY